MNSREVKWIVALIALIGVYYFLFHKRFASEQIVINASLRPSRRANSTVFPVFFTLNDDFRLTSVEVIPYQGNTFDPHERPAWHLISDSNSVPTRAFRYGQWIKGMKPALPNTRADALVPDVPYRLIVTAGKVSAYKDFKTKPAMP